MKMQISLFFNFGSERKAMGQLSKVFIKLVYKLVEAHQIHEYSLLKHFTSFLTYTNMYLPQSKLNFKLQEY
jgi:hypothetical protein